MKFGHSFMAALQEEEYPLHWVKSAIHYKELKKCIKEVQRELSSVGLSPHVIKIIQTSTDNSEVGNHLRYTYSGGSIDFGLKLALNLNDMSSLGSDFAPEAVANLRTLKLQYPVCSNLGPKSNHVFIPPENSATGRSDGYGQETPCTLDNGPIFIESPLDLNKRLGRDGSGCNVLTMSNEDCLSGEITLRSDRKFFVLLNNMIMDLRDLRNREEAELKQAIFSLGRDISQLAAPNSSRSDMYAWREAFSLYVNDAIFFSTVDSESRNSISPQAVKRLQAFFSKLQVLNFPRRLKSNESRKALQKFGHINLVLLRNLNFQELNETAISKILKKFDKRTSLQARQIISEIISKCLTSTMMAKTLCFELNQKVLGVVPQLNDYSCPVCFNISFKPIRLGCGHVFCIRCIVILQRSNNNRCPLCRASVVMQADSGNLDCQLMNFLSRYFPREVKAKQKENEHAAAVDRYGEHMECQVM